RGVASWRAAQPGRAMDAWRENIAQESAGAPPLYEAERESAVLGSRAWLALALAEQEECDEASAMADAVSSAAESIAVNEEAGPLLQEPLSVARYAVVRCSDREPTGMASLATDLGARPAD